MGGNLKIRRRERGPDYLSDFQILESFWKIRKPIDVNS
jgi:hypothetical protein